MFDSATSWTAASQALSSAISPEFAQIHVHWGGDAIKPSYPLLPSSPFAFSLSRHRVFSSGSALPNRWSKYWSFSISPFNEYSGLISFRIDWFDFPEVWFPCINSKLLMVCNYYESIHENISQEIYINALILHKRFTSYLFIDCRLQMWLK